MKMVEIKFRATMNELNKLNASLERAIKKLEKKEALAEKCGVAEWTKEDRHSYMADAETDEFGFLLNKDDIKKNGAWFDLITAREDVDEIREKIKRTEERFERAEKALEEHNRELAEIADLKEKEKLLKLDFEQEQKEWLKDGITLDKRYSGKTPGGKNFCIYGNSGYTKRSLHCFTLCIDGETIFTSGEFWRAYGVVKNS